MTNFFASLKIRSKDYNQDAHANSPNHSSSLNSFSTTSTFEIVSKDTSGKLDIIELQPSELVRQNYTTVLQVKVVEAKDLRLEEIEGFRAMTKLALLTRPLLKSSNEKVKYQLFHRQNQKTKIVKDNEHPRWEEVFQFFLRESSTNKNSNESPNISSVISIDSKKRNSNEKSSKPEANITKEDTGNISLRKFPDDSLEEQPISIEIKIVDYDKYLGDVEHGKVIININDILSLVPNTVQCAWYNLQDVISLDAHESKSEAHSKGSDSRSGSLRIKDRRSSLRLAGLKQPKLLLEICWRKIDPKEKPIPSKPIISRNSQSSVNTNATTTTTTTTSNTSNGSISSPKATDKENFDNNQLDNTKSDKNKDVDKNKKSKTTKSKKKGIFGKKEKKPKKKKHSKFDQENQVQKSKVSERLAKEQMEEENKRKEEEKEKERIRREEEERKRKEEEEKERKRLQEEEEKRKRIELENRWKTMDGFLTKRGHVITNWKLRYFTIKDKELLYYKDKTQLKGKIPLQYCSVKIVPSVENHENCFVIKPHAQFGKKEYVLSADTSEEQMEW